MKKTKRIKIKVNNKIYTKLQELKKENKSISKTVVDILLNNRINGSFGLTDSNFVNCIYIRLTEEEYKKIKSKFNVNMNIQINYLLERELQLISKKELKERQQSKREFEKCVKDLELIFGRKSV